MFNLVAIIHLILNTRLHFISRKTKGNYVSVCVPLRQFYPKKSWYLKSKVNSHILEHERLHFDITELHARMFRQRIEKTRFTMNIDAQMNRLHEAINKELEALQNRYDAETRHSQDLEKQQEWQTKIIEALNKLSRYSS